MGLRINNPSLSLGVRRALETSTKALNRSLQRLASGMRITHPADDASGLAVSVGLDAQIRGDNQSILNMNDAKSWLSTAEGAVSSQVNVLQRMRELALQAANGTLGSQDRGYLNAELQQLFTEYERIVDHTDFNGTKLLNGDADQLQIQVGSRGGEFIRGTLSSLRASQVFQKTIGSGTFSSAATVSVGTGPSASPVLADLNDDGNLDLIATNSGSDNVSVRLGQGDGSFTTAATLDVGALPTSAPVVVDLNNDGSIDAVVSAMDGSISVFIGDGEGSFTTASTLYTGAFYPASSPVLADLNSDGNLDLLQANTQDGSVSVFIGGGDGSFTATATVSVGAYPNISPLLADLNNDEKLDMVVTNYSSGEISVCLGNGDGSFSTAATLSTGSISYGNSPVLADLNRDGNLDLLQAVYFEGSVYVRLGNGDGSFSAAALLSVGAYPNASPVLADLNNDGKLDWVVANSADNSVSVRLGNGDGSFSTAATLSVGATPYSSPVLADLNGDGILDLAVSNQGSSSVSIRFGKGDGSFTTGRTLSVGSNPGFSPVVGDLDGDEILDLIVLSQGTASVAIRLQGSQTTSAVEDVTILTQADAQDLLSLLDDAIDNLNSFRSNIGALSNRLDSAVSVTSVTSENLQSALSQIRDADVAAETAELTKRQVLQQAQVAVLGQANTQLQSVLRLLQPS